MFHRYIRWIAFLQVLFFFSPLKLWAADTPLATGTELVIKGTIPINSVVFSPDGRYVLSGHLDNTPRLWELETGKIIRIFRGHEDFIWSVAFSPNGRFVLSGSQDRTLRLWKTDTGETGHVFKGHTGVVKSVAFSPDGQTLLSGSADGTLRLWDVETRKQIRVLEKHETELWSVAFSLTGTQVLSGDNEGMLRLWDVDTGTLVREFRGHKDAVSSVAFSPDGRYILSGSLDGTLRSWSTDTGKKVRDFIGHNSAVRSAAFSPDGKRILSGSMDGEIWVWEVETGQDPLKIRDQHNGAANTVASSPSGRTLLSGGVDGELKLRFLDFGTTIISYVGFPMRFIALGPDDWITLTSEGYYATSKGAWQYISLNIPNPLQIDGPLPVLHRPDKIADALPNFPPETAIVAKEISDNDITIYFSGEDGRTPSEALQYSWRLDGESWTPSSRDAQIQFRELKSGLHTFEVRAQDADGGIDLTPAKLEFTIGAKTPVKPPLNVDVSNRPTRPILGTNYTFEFAVKEPPTPSNPLQYAWRLDSGDWSGYSANPQADLQKLSEGRHLLEVRAKDAEGNLAFDYTTFTVAKQSPEIKITNPPTGVVTGPDYTFKFEGSDLQTPTNRLKYEWRLDESKWSEVFDTEAQLTRLKGGTNLFEVRVTDTDGNSDTDVAVFTVENQFPDTEISISSNRNTSVFQLRFSGIDLQTPRNLQYSWRRNGGIWSKFSDQTFVELPDLASGTHLFQARARDEDGNIDLSPAEEIITARGAPTASDEFIRPKSVEFVPPETKIEGRVEHKLDVPITFREPKNRREFQLNAVGGVGSISYSWRLDGGPWTQLKLPEPVITVKNLTNGFHILEARAIDSRWSEDLTPAQYFFSVVISEQIPTVSILTEELPDPIEKGSYPFKCQGSDIQTPNQLKYRWKIDDNTWSTYSDNSQFHVENLTNGEHTLYVQCRDPDEYSAVAQIQFNVDYQPEILDLKKDEKDPFTFTVIARDQQTLAEALVYEYRLTKEGEDKLNKGEWSDSKSSTIRLNGLGHGKNYTLSLRATDEDGNKSKEFHRPDEVRLAFLQRTLVRRVIWGFCLVALTIAAAGWLRFRQKRQNALKTRYNPYNPGSPVMEKSKFFGRDEFLRAVKASIHHSNFIIMGDNRIGKTSVLHRLADELGTDKDYLYLPFYIDISFVEEEEVLFEKLLMETRRQVAKILPALDWNSILKEDTNNFYRFQDAIGAILDALEESGTGGKQLRLIFMLDECDVLNGFGLVTKSKIRSIFTQRYAQNVSAILVGVNIYRDPKDTGSPWWNSFKVQLMTPFTDKEVRALIKEPAGAIYRFEDKAIELILDWSERNPYLVQLLCHEGVNMAIDDRRWTITESDIQTVIPRSQSEKNEIRKAPTIEEVEEDI